MADISDVLTVLRDAVAAALDAVGMVQPSQTSKGIRVYTGWPGADLDADLKSGVTQVTIWPRAGMARVQNAYLTGWREAPRVAPSLTVTIANDAATFAGTGTVPEQIAAVIVDRASAYTYPLQPSNGPAEVAAALAALIAADRTASASGAVLTVPGAFSLVARVVAGGSERREIRRLSQGIQIDVWAPSPKLRDTIARTIDDALIEEYRTLDMPDSTKATITYDGTSFDEAGRQQPLHRRSLMISAEYSQVRVRSAAAIAVPGATIEVDPSRITRTVIS